MPFSIGASAPRQLVAAQRLMPEGKAAHDSLERRIEIQSFIDEKTDSAEV